MNTTERILELAGARALEALPVPVAVHDVSGRVVWANAEYRAAAEASLDALQGQGCHEAFGVAAGHHGCPVARALETGVPAEGGIDSGNGGADFLARVRLLREEDGAVAGAVEVLERAVPGTSAFDALRDSVKFLRYIVKHDPNAIAVCDRRMRYLAVSDRFLRDYGVEDQLVLGKSHYEVFPDMPESWRAVHQRVLKGETIRNDDDCFVRSDGSVTYNRWECRPWYGAEGDVGGLVMYTEVTTERKLAKRALKESETKYRALFDHMTLGFALHEMVLDAKGRPVDYIFLEVNEAFERLTGLKKDQIEGKRVTTVLPDIREDPADWIGTYGEIALNQGRVEFEQYSEPLKRWYSVVAFSPGRERFATIVEDITERKRAVEKLKLSENRLHAVFDAVAGVPIQGYDVERNVVFWNQASEQLFGYRREEALGRKLEELIVPEPHRARTVERIGRWVSAQTPTGASELTLQNRAGKKIPVYASHIMITNLDGDRELFSVLVDLTGQKRMEEEKRRIEKLESLGMVAGGIAHDFNNLLTGVFGLIEMAKLRLPAHHEASQLLGGAHQAMDRARTLTGRLLTFSKGGSPVIERLEVSSRIRDAVNRCDIDSKVSVSYRFPEDLWGVLADAQQMHQVFSALIHNAVEAMPEGGTLSVEAENLREIRDPVTPRLRGAFVRLRFGDEGVGMDRKVLARIFDPYFSTKPGASGLGLSVAHSIVTRHEGHISVSSTSGEGSVFTLYLPAEGESRAEEAPVEEEKAKDDTGRKVKVLLMDDEEMILKITSRMLEYAGYEVEVALDGRAAIDAYRAAMASGRPFDVVLMDLTIPNGMGGKEAVRELLAMDPAAKVIVSSGYSSDTVMSEYTEHGFVGCLNKPFRTQDLEEEIRRVLRGG